VRYSIEACDVESTRQRWTIEHRGAATLEIRSDHSGACLDVTAASTADGAELQQFGCHGGPNQRFRAFAAFPVGPQEISPVASSALKCASVALASTADGADVVQLPCGGGAHERFLVTAISPPGRERFITAEHSGRRLSMPAVPTSPPVAIPVDGVPVFQHWSGIGFAVQYVGYGFQLRVAFGQSSLCLSIPENDRGIDGAPLRMALCNDGEGQRFFVR
jgi:hypothetical protein